MRVTFPDDDPVFDGAQMVVRFVAAVDDVPVSCAITAEALEDHFGAGSTLEAELLRAYARGRDRIRAVCTRAIEESRGAAVVLRSGLFRIASASNGPVLNE
ncbi:DUF1488 domain-containing protein [Trinickia diaoshuihuensis]|jgi:hypothetical protein|uniref:DUF1488 domain-containing protein n=1 Tax=Trinickia diaoshuihuensis TaxID=2292265 RepID=UPI000E260775|nr:DUF1488 domain-containing protein [Trinickia diaoshuihuensis]